MEENEERLKIYDKVNKAESLKELSDIILSLADEYGIIQGRTRPFRAETTSIACKNYNDLFNKGYANVLTREFGIRQQAMYIIYYINTEL